MTIPICARRLSCVTSRMSCPSIRIRPDFQVVEKSQEQIDQGRFTGAGAADQPDAFARLHHQRQILDHLARGAVVEPHVLETDFPVPNHGRQCAGTIADLVRFADGIDRVLQGADVFEQRRDSSKNPTGHLVQNG